MQRQITYPKQAEGYWLVNLLVKGTLYQPHVGIGYQVLQQVKCNGPDDEWSKRHHMAVKGLSTLGGRRVPNLNNRDFLDDPIPFGGAPELLSIAQRGTPEKTSSFEQGQHGMSFFFLRTSFSRRIARTARLSYSTSF